MSNSIPCKTMDVITYPCHQFSWSISVKQATVDRVKLKFIVHVFTLLWLGINIFHRYIIYGIFIHKKATASTIINVQHATSPFGVFVPSCIWLSEDTGAAYMTLLNLIDKYIKADSKQLFCPLALCKQIYQLVTTTYANGSAAFDWTLRSH